MGKLIDPKPNHHCFELRDGETGVSVNLKSLISYDDFLKLPGAKPNSLVCEAMVKEIRNLKLEIEIVPMDNSPGHCEIRSTAEADLKNKGGRLKLCEVFKLVNNL